MPRRLPLHALHHSGKGGKRTVEPHPKHYCLTLATRSGEPAWRIARPERLLTDTETSFGYCWFPFLSCESERKTQPGQAHLLVLVKKTPGRTRAAVFYFGFLNHIGIANLRCYPTAQLFFCASIDDPTPGLVDVGISALVDWR
jgi:hypothetical protein